MSFRGNAGESSSPSMAHAASPASGSRPPRTTESLGSRMMGYRAACGSRVSGRISADRANESEAGKVHYLPASSSSAAQLR